MALPFSSAEFFEVFRRYNEAIEPFQILLVVAAAFAAVIPWARVRSSRHILLVLAFFWIWMAIVYHGVFFSRINPAALLFGVMFTTQAALLGWTALKNRCEIAPAANGPGFTGIALVLYALVLYPTIGFLTGHRYPSAPTFGLPCPTTIFTIGLLLWTKPLRNRLFVIPLVWSLIGTSAAFSLGVFEDAGLLVAAVVAGALLRADVRRRKHVVGQVGTA